VIRPLALLSIAGLLAACGGQPRQSAPPPPAPEIAAPKPEAPKAQGPDWTKLPLPSGAVDWSGPIPELLELPNGLKVYYLKQGPTPLVTLALVMARGSAADPKGKAGLTALTVDLLDEGAGGKNALELSEELQRLGTDFFSRTDVDHVMLGMNLLAESFEPSARIFADIVRRPALSAAEFTRRRDQRIAEALSRESEPNYGRDVVLKKVLFADGYGGDPPNGTRTTLKGLGHAEVKAHYSKLVGPEAAALIVVGGIDREPIEQALRASFGDWKGNTVAAPAAVSDLEPERGLYFVDYPGTTQSALSVARRAEGQRSEEYFPAMVFSRAFGEAFSSRLNLNLREDKGYTYGARASFTRWDRAGYFGLHAGVKAETTRPSVDEMLKELREVCSTRPLSAKERREAIEGLQLGLPGRFESGANVAGQLVALPLHDRAPDWFARWPDRVSAVTLDAANQLGKKYCDPTRFVIVVAGDWKSVGPTLEGLGLPAIAHDAQGRRLGGAR
jgi:zinc protease